MSDAPIKIKFNNWDKYNKRAKDIRNPFWFSMSNNFFYDPEFYEFTAEEKCTFFYLLAECSRGSKYGECTIIATHYARITGFKDKVLYTTLDKLLKLKVAAEWRQDGGGNPASTGQDRTEQDNTGINTLVVSSKPTETVKFDLELIYKAYPKRLGENRKKIGLVRLGKIVGGQEDFDLAMRAVVNYKSHQEKIGKIGTEFVKQFAVFWDSQGDWTEWAAIDSNDTKTDWKTRMMEKLK